MIGMNAAVNHIMQIVDWKRFTLEEWLYQFGAWLYSNTGTCGKSINPIAIAMEGAAKKKKIAVKNKEQIIADWINSGEDAPKPVRKPICCEITDNEARAVQRLIIDMQGQSEVLDGWLRMVIYRYFYGNSFAQLVNNQMTLMDVKFDVKCGLAAIHARYPFIEYKLKAA